MKQRNKYLLLTTALTILSANALGYTSLSFSPKVQKQDLSLLSTELGRPNHSIAGLITKVSGSVKNWGIFDAGSTAHIQTLKAWEIETGSKDIIVGVVDTGLDATHPDLKGNLWSDPKNPGVYGYNFVTESTNPGDDNGHGTHIAGIIGAIANPSAGISGVAQKVSIMPVKFYSDSNPPAVNVKNTARAIEYAVQHGARIINYSGGGAEFSEEEYLAVKKAEAAGVLFVAAAGNEKSDTDLVSNYYYPAAYGLTNIISVAGTDKNGKLFRGSNWGKRKVDVAAPGDHIYSTLPTNRGKYGYMTGTSQATAFVSGLAALLLSKNPKLTPSELKSIIKETVDRTPELADKVASGGRVNAHAALVSLQEKLKPALKSGPTLVLNPVPTTQLLSMPQ
jgi:thermitase